MEVCVRRPPCARHHLHGAGIRKPSQNSEVAVEPSRSSDDPQKWIGGTEVPMTILNGSRPTSLPVDRLHDGIECGYFSRDRPTYPHDPLRPELRAWFQSLKNKTGEPCCDTGDGQPAEVEWDMAKGGCMVLSKHPLQASRTGAMVRRAVLRRDRPAEPQRYRDGFGGRHPTTAAMEVWPPSCAASFRDRGDDPHLLSRADQPGVTAEFLRMRVLREFARGIAFKDGADHEQDGTGDCIRAGVDRTSVGTEGRD